MGNILLQATLIIFIYMTSIFFIALIRKNNSIADSAWGIGFILLAFYTLFSTDCFLYRQILTTGLVTIWGLRLSAHIFLRNWGRGEDPRYKAWRESWGTYVIPRSFLYIFMLQGGLLLIIAYPILIINTKCTPQGIIFYDVFGSLIWLIGFLFESIGDYQLYRFISNTANKNRILTSGLWRYTRHPNYFGETLIWWGFFFIALSVPYGWTALISPLTITYLLVYISGIPTTEALFKENKEYAIYKQQTSMYIPWIPKK